MQKVKDRKARLAEREEIRQAKQAAMDDLPASVKETDARRQKMREEQEKGGGRGGKKGPGAQEEVKVFEDEFTYAAFGDSVVVTTFLGIAPGEEEGEVDMEGGVGGGKAGKKKGDGVDKEQLHAGSVARFKRLLTGNMPAKKKKKERENTSGSFMPRGGKGKEEEALGGKKGKKAGKRGGRKR